MFPIYRPLMYLYKRGGLGRTLRTWPSYLRHIKYAKKERVHVGVFVVISMDDGVSVCICDCASRFGTFSSRLVGLFVMYVSYYAGK